MRRSILRQHTKKGSLDSIPNEILAIIEQELHLQDVANLTHSCRYLHESMTPLLYRRASPRVDVTLWAAARGEVGTLENLFHAGADLNKDGWEEETRSLSKTRDLYRSITVDTLQDQPSARFSLQHTLHRQVHHEVHSLSSCSLTEMCFFCQPKTLTALTLAVKMGHEQVIDFRLLHGASVNQRCQQICHCESVCSAIYPVDLDLNPYCAYDWTPLYLAIHHGHLRLAKNLMAKGASFESSRSDNDIPSMTNALDIALAAGDITIFAAVFDHFASSIKQWHKRNALDFAYMHGSMDVFHFLLDHGVGIDDPATHAHGTTILMEACASSYFADAFWILQLGADASKTTKVKMTTLDCLCRQLDQTMQEWCDDLYEGMLSDLKDKLSDLRATMELLLENGADPNMCIHRGDEPVGELPLVVAAKWCQIHMITLLLDYDADINPRGHCSDSPLWTASRSRMPARDMVATISLLIERGASVHTGDEIDSTILDNITYHSNPERVDFTALVSLVLDRGLTPEAGVRGDTWIAKFRCCGQLECCKLLAKHGAADPDHRDVMDMLQYTVNKNNVEAVEYILALKGMEKQTDFRMRP